MFYSLKSLKPDFVLYLTVSKNLCLKFNVTLNAEGNAACTGCHSNKYRVSQQHVQCVTATCTGCHCNMYRLSQQQVEGVTATSTGCHSNMYRVSQQHVQGVTATRYSLIHNICHPWCRSEIRTNTIYVLAFPF